MKNQWPTLQGRLNDALKNDIDALNQLKEHGMELSDNAKKLLNILTKKRKNKQHNFK